MIPEGFAQYASKIMLGLVAVVLSLVGIIYRGLTSRIEKCETNNDKILKLLIETASDVKHIKENCSKC